MSGKKKQNNNTGYYRLEVLVCFNWRECKTQDAVKAMFPFADSLAGNVYTLVPTVLRQ